VLSTDGRSSILEFYQGSSGHPYATKNSACQTISTHNSPNTKPNTPKSSEDENWLGWTTSVPSNWTFTFKIARSLSKYLRFKPPSYIPSKNKVLLPNKLQLQKTPLDGKRLTLFSERMTIGEVADELECGAVSVRRAVMFWALHGVLKEVAPDTFCVLEQADSTALNQSTLLTC
jgi:hypothetical protein